MRRPKAETEELHFSLMAEIAVQFLEVSDYSVKSVVVFVEGKVSLVMSEIPDAFEFDLWFFGDEVHQCRETQMIQGGRERRPTSSTLDLKIKQTKMCEFRSGVGGGGRFLSAESSGGVCRGNENSIVRTLTLLGPWIHHLVVDCAQTPT
jgi:hypothetical protein